MTVKNERSVNPLLGDASFIHTFGYAPSANADEDVRITTHLAYVEQLLRDADVSALLPVQLATGVVQTTMGIIEFPKDEESRWDDKPIANIGKRNVSLLNIGLGTANVLLS